jgi:hypothetical protein
MGMFDWYEPAITPRCETCGEDVLYCQGKDAVNALLVWREGISGLAIEQRVDEPLDRLDPFGLPYRFTFTCWCPNDHAKNFVGECTDGVWSKTIPQTSAELRQASHQ